MQAVRHPSGSVKRILAGLRNNGFALVRGGDPTPHPSPNPNQGHLCYRCGAAAPVAVAPVAAPGAAGSVPGLRWTRRRRRRCPHSISYGTSITPSCSRKPGMYATQASNPRLADRVSGRSATHTRASLALDRGS